MTRMKKGKNPFTSKKFNKDFEKSKVRFYNCDKKGHYSMECKAKKKGKYQFHASTAII